MGIIALLVTTYIVSDLSDVVTNDPRTSLFCNLNIVLDITRFYNMLGAAKFTRVNSYINFEKSLKHLNGYLNFMG